VRSEHDHPGSLVHRDVKGSAASPDAVRLPTEVSADEYEANDHTLREIRRLSLETQSPLHRLETRLAPYVAFGIVPLFAFANAGLTLRTKALSAARRGE
jgi:Na+/H+ antiporter NhaA